MTVEQHLASEWSKPSATHAATDPFEAGLGCPEFFENNMKSKDFGSSTDLELGMRADCRQAYPRLTIEGMEAMLKK